MNVGDSGTSATLMWVAEHAGKVNATKRERMAAADERTQQVEELNRIKQLILKAKTSGDAKDVQAAIAEMDTFVREHGGDEGFDDIARNLDTAKEELNSAAGTAPGPPPPKEQDQTAYSAAKPKWDNFLDDASKAIDDLAQTIGQHDQLEIMRITTLDQSENRFYELGSNKIANDGKTVNALIGNIRV